MSGAFGCVGLEYLFRMAFADTVGIVEFGLDGGGEDDEWGAADGDQLFADVVRQTGIAGFELRRILWAVDAGQVEDDVRLIKQTRKFIGAIFDIKRQNCDVPTSFEMGDKVTADEAVTASY